MLRQVMVPLVLSGIGVVVGMLGCFVLFFGYGNPDVGFWSLLSTTFAGICFHLHWVKGRETLEIYHTTWSLRNITHVGFVGGVICATAVIWYIFLTAYYNVPSPSVSENTIIKAVWAFICGKWGFVLMYYGDKYEIIIRENPSSILSQDSA